MTVVSVANCHRVVDSDRRRDRPRVGRIPSGLDIQRRALCRGPSTNNPVDCAVGSDDPYFWYRDVACRDGVVFIFTAPDRSQ